MLTQMLPGRHIVAAALGVALALGPAFAAAGPDDEATRLHRLGYERGKAGDYAGAIAAFKAAYKLHAKPVLIRNIGLAYEHWGRLPQAELFLSRCDAHPPKRRAANFRTYSARTKNKLTRGSFARIRITSKPTGATVRVSGFAPDETFTTPHTIWLAYGEHEVTLRKKGHRQRVEKLSVINSAARDVVVHLEPAPPKPVAGPAEKHEPPVRVTVPKQRPVTEPLAVPPPPRPTRARSSRLPLYVTAAGALLLAGGVTTHVFAARARDAASSATPTPPGQTNTDYQRNLEAFRTRRAMTIGLYATGGAALAVGLYLYTRKHATRERPSVALTPFATSRSAGVSFVWVR